MVQQSAAVAFVLALLAAMLWVLRRKGLARFNVAFPKRTGSQRQMELIERIPLTPSHSLHLVRIQNRIILIGVSPSGCNQIESFAVPAEPSGTGSGI